MSWGWYFDISQLRWMLVNKRQKQIWRPRIEWNKATSFGDYIFYISELKGIVNMILVTFEPNLATQNGVRESDSSWKAWCCPRCVNQHRCIVSLALRCQFNDMARYEDFITWPDTEMTQDRNLFLIFSWPLYWIFITSIAIIKMINSILYFDKDSEKCGERIIIVLAFSTSKIEFICP